MLGAIGWDAPQLVRAVNRLRAGRGLYPLHRTAGYVWVSGEHPPGPGNASDVLAVLSQRLRRDVTGRELGWDKPRRSTVRCLDRPGEARIDDLLREIQQGESMQRRRFLLLGGGAVTGTALTLMIPGQAAAFRSAETGSKVTGPLIDSIRSAVRSLRALDDSTGSTSGLDWADTLMQGLARILRNSTYTDAQAQQLFTAFVELSETYGWMQFDANRHPTAQRLYQAGLRLAAGTGPASPELDDATRNLCASTAYQAAWLGQHDEAQTLLAIATRPTGGRPLPASLDAVLAERAMYAAGQRGDTDAVHAAQERAHDRLDAAGRDGVEQPWWAQWLGRDGVDATAGRALLATGDTRAAEPYLARRVASLDDAYPRDRLVVTLDLAKLYQLGGDPVAAAAITVKQLDAHPEVDSPRLATRLDDLVAALAPHRDQPIVRDLVTHSART
jgi:hypothetical protein